MAKRSVIQGGVLLVLVFLAGCVPSRFNPARATRPYPRDLHSTTTVDIQVFRDRQFLEIVNSTATSYEDFDLWVNQRFVRSVDNLQAGSTIRLSLWEFFDERGEVMNAGGIWRTQSPTPVRLVQIQPAEDEPMIGLITIRAEDASLPQ